MNIDLKKFYKSPIFILCIIVILTIIIALFKFYQNPKDIKTLKSIGTAISNINLTYNIDKDNINSITYIDSLESKISNLENITRSTETLSLKEEYLPLLEKLKEGLSNNISLYKQLIDMLKRNNFSSPSTSYDNAISIKNTTKELYETCTNKGIPVYLNNSNSEHLDNIFLYINEIVKLNRDTDIKLKQKNEFLTNIEKIRRDFTPLMENLFETLKLIKSDNRDINILSTDIHKKLMDFQTLKNELYMISIPKNKTNLFTNLEQLCNLYEDYINSFLKALKEEINSKKEQTLLYNQAKEKFTIVENQLKTFDEELKKIKNN